MDNMPGISDAITRTKLNDPVSQVDVTKYQQGPNIIHLITY